MEGRKEILQKCRENLFSDIETEHHTEEFEGMFVDPEVRDFIKILNKK